MRVYVAGRFTKKEDVQAMQDRLVKAGHTITFDWTKSSANGKLREERLRYLAEQANLDFEGVRGADAIVVLHDDTGRGLFVEFGIALADPHKIVAVVGGQYAGASGCVFYHMPRVRHFCTPEGAAEFLAQADQS